MTQKRLLLVALFITLIFNTVYGGIELRSKQMRTSDGIPNNSVRYMYQDSKGFLWLATLNGLSRYDGNSFLTFRPESGEKVSLADNRIYDLTEDKNGFLWISTTPELFSCYDLQRACFVDYTGTGALEQNYSAVFIAAMGMYGFGIRPMDVVESSTRKTGKWYLLNLRRNVVICRITGYNLLMKMPVGEFGLERNVDWYRYLTVSIKWKIVCFILLLLWHLKIICIF